MQWELYGVYRYEEKRLIAERFATECPICNETSWAEEDNETFGCAYCGIAFSIDHDGWKDENQNIIQPTELWKTTRNLQHIARHQYGMKTFNSLINRIIHSAYEDEDEYSCEYIIENEKLIPHISSMDLQTQRAIELAHKVGHIVGVDPATVSPTVICPNTGKRLYQKRTN